MKSTRRIILIFALIIILIFSVVLSLDTLLTSFAVRNHNKELSSSYSEVTIYVCATDKISFADEMDHIYKQSVKNGIVKDTSTDVMVKLIEDVTWEMNEKIVFEEKLRNYGVYLFPTSIETANIGVNVSLSKPMIFYNAKDQTWIVTHSGNWINNKWDQNLFAGVLGKKDTYGIKYTNISGTFHTAVNSVYAYIADKDNNKKKTTTNRSGANEGFCFEFEDYTYGLLKKKYVGYKWYGSCVYDSNWKNFGSYITAYHDPQ